MYRIVEASRNRARTRPEARRAPKPTSGARAAWQRFVIGCLACLVVALCGSTPTLYGAVDLEEARYLAGRGEDSAALERLEAALGAEGEDAEALLLKGVLLTRLGRTDEAKGVFLTLIQLHPELPEPYNNLAALYGSSGDYEQAIEVLKLALRTHPSYEIVYENLTRVYGRLAGQAYDRALGVELESPAEPVDLDLLEVVGERLETTPSKVAATRATQHARTPAAETSETPATVSPTESASKPVPATKPPPPAAGSPPSTGAGSSAPAASVPAFRTAPETVLAWAKAWSDQRVEDYLGFYSDRFSPPSGLTRATWAAQRRERISRPGFIDVTVVEELTEQTGENTVRVRFRQSYRSDNYSDVVVKILDLVWEQDRWKIYGERVERGAA